MNNKKIVLLLLFTIFILIVISLKSRNISAEPFLSKVVLRQEISRKYPAYTWQKQITTTHFIIYYNVTGSNGVSDSYASQVGSGLENAWNVFVTRDRFKTPESADGGRIEVMIRELGRYAGVTHCVYIGGQWKVDYIEIDDDLSGKDSIYDVTGHEFFHCIQAAHNAIDESGWIVEGMAVAAEDRAYDTANNYVYWVNKFMDNPDKPLTSRSYDAALFWIYIWEFKGTGTIKNILNALVSKNGVDGVNAGLGGKFVDTIIAWSRTNYFKEEYSEGNLYHKIKLTKKYTFTGASIKWSESVSGYASDYYELLSKQPIMKIEVKGSGIKVRLIAGSLNVFISGSYTLTDADKYSKIVIIVTNTGGNSKSYQLSLKSGRAFSVSCNAKFLNKVNPNDIFSTSFTVKNVGTEEDTVTVSVSSSNSLFKFKVFENGVEISFPQTFTLNVGDKKSFDLKVYAPEAISNTNIKITVSDGRITRNIVFKVASTGLKIVVDAPKLVNVGEEVSVKIYLYYEGLDEPVPKGVVYLNGETIVLNNYGYYVKKYRYNEIYTLNIYAYGKRDESGKITYIVNKVNKTITWTRMKLYVPAKTFYVNASKPLVLRFKAVYEHDNSTISFGEIAFNNTVLNFTSIDEWCIVKLKSMGIGRYKIYVRLALDETGRIKSSNTVEIEVIWTSIVIKANISKTFLNIGEYTELYVEAYWSHNDSKINDVYIFVEGLNETLHLKHGLKYFNLTSNMPKIFQLKIYGIRAPHNITEPYNVEKFNVTWTCFKIINISYNKLIANRGDEIRLGFHIVYGHNNSPPENIIAYLNTGEKAISYVNGTILFKMSRKNDLEEKVFIKSIQDNRGIYKLIENKSIVLVWTHMIIDKVLYPKYCTINSLEKVYFRVVFAHNGQPISDAIIEFNGSYIRTNSSGWSILTLNESNPGKHTYMLKPILGQYNITDGEERKFTLIWLTTIMSQNYVRIMEIKNMGYNITPALKLWNKSIQLLEINEIRSAERVSNSSLEMAENIMQAINSIEMAKKAISSASESGRIVLLFISNYYLSISINLFDQGKYLEAKNNAEMAKMIADISPHWLMIVVIILIIIGIIIYKKHKSHSKKSK